MKLSGYQIEAVNRFLENPTYADYDVPGALAGKSAVAAMALDRRDTWPALITCPAHLIPQWTDELVRWGYDADDIYGCPKGTKPYERIEALTGAYPVVIVSYNVWARKEYQTYLLDPRWQGYVFDEAHRLRKWRLGKRGSSQAIAWLRTKSRSKHMKTPAWLLSGTPLVSDATDVFPLLHLSNPYRYKSRRDFAINTCFTAQTPYGLKVGKVRDREAFNKLLGTVSIRRTYAQIPELRHLRRRDIPLPLMMDPELRANHRAVRKDYRNPVTGEPIGSSAQMIHTLRQLTMPMKADAAVELLEDHPGRILFFTWYRDSGRLLRDRLERRTRKRVCYVDGGTRDRETELRHYRNDPRGLLVGTIGALGEGANLQQGYTVVFAEQSYLATDNEQATNRVFRRGQTQPVLIFHLYVRGSFDARVKRIADKREADIEQALNDFLEEDE